jgi:hypothetical protein
VWRAEFQQVEKEYIVEALKVEWLKREKEESLNHRAYATI